jgi:predicted house-cleaning noncanonical NTP pyrophosphatase (MazG superfamily)
MSKLVRDQIPEIMKMQGKNPDIRYATDDEYWNLLLHKLYEEVVEFTQNPCLEELADISEVTLSLAKCLGITESQIQNMRKEKKTKRGGFERKCILISDGGKYE